MSATMAPPAVATGRFIWRDVRTSDPERIKAFYTELFGWTIESSPMGEYTYDMWLNNGEHFGGIMPFCETDQVSPEWISYINVPDVDAAVATAQRLGGTVTSEPMDIPEVGRFATICDPQGANCSLMTPLPRGDGSIPAQEMPPLGAVTWNELTAPDVAAAEAFYTETIGWRAGDSGMPVGMPYTIFWQGERMDAGMMAAQEGMPGALWVIYYHVADIDQSVADVARLGGQQLFPIMDVPSIGRVCWAVDPTGATFGLHEAPKGA